MHFKICGQCAEKKEITEYHKNKIKSDGLCLYCKQCIKAYQTKNRDKISKQRKQYKIDNKHKIIKWREDNKERSKPIVKAWKEKNRAKLNQIQRDRCKTDISFKVGRNLRGRINRAIKNTNNYKSEKTINLLGCSIDELKIHLEKQFKDGMSWSNYGFYGWHIDHIKPCVTFDLSNPEEQKICFHYTNLQPLWAKENLSKGARF
jgi:hypothetical protein